MAASTRARVAAATSVRPFRTLETVATDTPVSAAMAEMVDRAAADSPGRVVSVVMSGLHGISGLEIFETR
ncbi:hypothetical protein NUM3379_23710 [Kineococcus sp. NUM-3379]